MKKNLMLMWLVFLGATLYANNDDTKRLLELCKPYSESNQLDIEIQFFNTKENKRKAVEKVVLKRSGSNLFLEQNDFAVLINETQLIEANKKKKELILRKTDKTYADRMFAGFSPSAFLTNARAVKEDKTYVTGQKFVVEFSSSSPYSREEIYFDNKGRLQKIKIEKSVLDPFTGKLTVELMEIIYTKSDFGELAKEGRYSASYFFTDIKKLSQTNPFKGFKISNHQNQ